MVTRSLSNFTEYAIILCCIMIKLISWRVLYGEGSLFLCPGNKICLDPRPNSCLYCTTLVYSQTEQNRPCPCSHLTWGGGGFKIKKKNIKTIIL